MYSLSAYEGAYKKGKVIGHYGEEVNAINSALDDLFKPLLDYNKRQKVNKKRQYRPVTTITFGNHENRIHIAKAKDPILINSLLDADHIHYEKYFDIILPYLRPYSTEGVMFVHNLTTMMGRPMGGAINPARTNLLHAKESVVVGHSHIYDLSVSARADGTKVYSLVAGHFINDTTVDQLEYAQAQKNQWLSGVSYLHDVKNGEYDLEFISVERVLGGNY